ncbi:nitric oxide-associated protein 1 [Drosophila guanche]|uniref:Blast:Nitric oxide-associated protein 1 n=1 Tax=Drosophila guanche TaxID=7266 RepID=A0A3B0J2Z1_DROGU|nr:nitric oxide-associated protein 1 [Drosophila guanche]SPP75647.1 blast:Nitric oxide-associated protein 1 [Drosophila guanche]
MLKNSRLFKIINNNVSLRWTRLHNSATDVTLSFRQKAWLMARERYKKHEHVYYSSVLETKWKSSNPPAPINSQFPHDWMDDYEFYEGSKSSESKHGTPDASLPPSTVPCSGCGAHLHCSNISMPGYIPSEIFKGRSQQELRTITCQRCHFLNHYNIALDVDVPPSSYVDTISRIQDQFALAVVLVDLLDFPSSIWPGMQHVLGTKRPVFLVGNKVDLLPRDCNSYLNHVKHCLQREFVQHGGGDGLNIKNVSLISAKTGYGIEELITQLHKTWAYKGNVYLLGCTNVGKSTLFNILLNSDYCRPEASELVRKATTCPWPGTTLQLLRFPIFRPSNSRVYQRFKRLFSERGERAALDKLRRDQAQKTGAVAAAQPFSQVGRSFDRLEVVNDSFSMAVGTQPITTLNERGAEYRDARWVYDTPGVMHPDQLTHLLTAEELAQLQPTTMIRPRAFRLRPEMSLMLGGLARIDILDLTGYEKEYDWLKIFVFASQNLPVMIADTLNAEAVYKRYLGTPFLGIPSASGDLEVRLKRWPGLQCKDQDIVVSNSNSNSGGNEDRLNCDITLSSAGWLGLLLPDNCECSLRVWTPHSAGIYVRRPALIPLADRLVGKHIRNSLAYNTTKPFVFKK